MAFAKLDEFYEAIEAEDACKIRTLLTEESTMLNSREYTPPPLHTAVYLDKPQAVQTLLEFDVDLELRDKDRDATPLDWAIVYAREKIVPLLVEEGSDTYGRLQTAKKGATGGFEEFEELPNRATYTRIVELLQSLGVAE